MARWQDTTDWVGGLHPFLLSNKLIMLQAADNALAFEVVTADGELVTADLTHNSDLFWALKGGGPGAFGVVISATLKAFPEVSSVGTYIF